MPAAGHTGGDDKDEGTETGGETQRSVGHVKGFFFTLTRKPLKVHMRSQEYLPLLHFADNAGFTNGGFVATLHRARLSAPFSNSICSFVSVSHFGNSRNISNSFMIIVLVLVVCAQ